MAPKGRDEALDVCGPLQFEMGWSLMKRSDLCKDREDEQGSRGVTEAHFRKGKNQMEALSGNFPGKQCGCSGVSRSQGEFQKGAVDWVMQDLEGQLRAFALYSEENH